MLGFANASELRKLRKLVRTAGRAPPPPPVIGPRLRPPPGPTYDERVQAWKIPFPGELVLVSTERCSIYSTACLLSPLSAL